MYNCIAYRGLQNFKKLEALIKVLLGMYVLCCAVFRMYAKPKHLTMSFPSGPMTRLRLATMIEGPVSSNTTKAAAWFDDRSDPKDG